MSYTYTVLTGDKTTSGSIKDWIARTDTPSATVLAEAEAWIYERLRVREMMARDEDFTFAINTSSLALPADFLDPISVVPWAWGSAELPFVHENALLENRDTTGAILSGVPSHWTIFGTTAYVDVKCQAAFGTVLNYYARPAALSADNETNFLTTRYPSLLRDTCLAFGYAHAKNWEQRDKYLAFAQAWLTDAAATNEMWRRSQSHPG